MQIEFFATDTASSSSRRPRRKDVSPLRRGPNTYFASLPRWPHASAKMSQESNDVVLCYATAVLRLYNVLTLGNTKIMMYTGTTMLVCMRTVGKGLDTPV